jgi:hypothetical protein
MRWKLRVPPSSGAPEAAASEPDMVVVIATAEASLLGYKQVEGSMALFTVKRFRLRLYCIQA